ncbi:MAG: sugar isomerase, partial [Clostridia bacterium]|nr:sugar isomerase [Clostridia bacterium]
MRSRTQKARLNMLTTLLSQLIAIVCGILIPRCMIGHFGSETYGATASIAQFLSYIALLEGGIGGVARAELYSPLAEQDKAGVSRVYHAVKRFLRVMGVAFGGYALMVAFFYHDIAGVTAFDRYFTCGLVLVIAVSTAAQYFVGLADLTLLHADQKRYISNLVVIVTTVFNTLLVLLLIRLGCSILVVKLVSSCVFLLRPVCFSLYVRTHYRLATPLRREPYILRQRWAGVG